MEIITNNCFSRQIIKNAEEGKVRSSWRKVDSVCYLETGININNLISVTTVNLFITVTNDTLTKHGLANMRSLKSKDQALFNYILEHQIDVFLVTET